MMDPVEAEYEQAIQAAIRRSDNNEAHDLATGLKDYQDNLKVNIPPWAGYVTEPHFLQVLDNAAEAGH